MTRHVGCFLALSLAIVACSDDGSGAGSAAGQGAAAGGATSGAGAADGGVGGASGVGATAGNGGSSPATGGMSGGLGGSGGADPDGGVDPDGSMIEPGDPGTVIGEPDDEANDLFDPSKLHTYDLIIAPAELATLNQNPMAEQYVQGMIEIDGEPHGPVGIRYKGSVGAFQPPCSNFDGSKTGKCSIKVAFDYLDEEARFLGIKKLNFHSMNNDPSQLRERLVYAMFRENGVASPRTAHARVLINGELEGLFLAIEQIDGRFTRARFTEGGEGNLYKEVWPMHDDPATYITALESNRDETPSAARILAFKAAIAAGPDAAEAFVDRDYILRYLAVDRVTINDDGAMHWWCTPLGQGGNPGGIGNHNYYWYEAENADRLWIIPWDTDMALSANPYVLINPEWNQPGACSCEGGGGGGGFSSMAALCDPLIESWASWQADYETAVDDFLAGAFREENVTTKLDAWTAQIDATVQESEGLNGAPFYVDWMNATQMLRSVVASARQNRGAPY